MADVTRKVTLSKTEKGGKKIPSKVLAEVEALPALVDWSQKGKVSPIRNQKNCGACWAFSAIAAAESAFAIKNSISATLLDFSEQ